MNRAPVVLRRYRLHLAMIASNVAFAAIFVTIALSGFHQPTPHHLPVGIVAPPPVTHTIQTNLEAHAPGGFDLKSLPSASARRAARSPVAPWMER